MQILKKPTGFSEFSSAFSKFRKYFEHFKKKDDHLYLIYVGNYGFRKTLLDIFLKSRVSEGPSKSNIVNEIKQCWSLNDTTFTIFIYHCEGH